MGVRFPSPAPSLPLCPICLVPLPCPLGRDAANMPAERRPAGDRMGQVESQIAIVTGGASGIGAACARTLAAEGARVIVTVLDDAPGESLAAAIGGVYLHHDVADEAGWPAVIAAAEDRFGRLDILIANAGIAVIGPLVEMSLADWRRQVAVNLDGVFLS